MPPRYPTDFSPSAVSGGGSRRSLAFDRINLAWLFLYYHSLVEML